MCDRSGKRRPWRVVVSDDGNPIRPPYWQAGRRPACLQFRGVESDTERVLPSASHGKRPTDRVGPPESPPPRGPVLGMWPECGEPRF